jgi:hypothetical protein
MPIRSSKILIPPASVPVAALMPPKALSASPNVLPTVQFLSAGGMPRQYRPEPEPTGDLAPAVSEEGRK